MSEVPLPNSPEARTETGELKDPSTITSTSSTSTTTSEPSDAPDPAPTPTGAPEAYAAYKAPDGYEVDAGAVERANTIFRELGLTQTQAQQLMDLQFSRDLEVRKGQETAIRAQAEKWTAELKADKDIGGKLDVVKADIGKAMVNLKPETREAFQTVMNETGIGNHPAFVKAFYELASKVNEGSHVTGSPAPVTKPSRPDIASAMYPNLRQ